MSRIVFSSVEQRALLERFLRYVTVDTQSDATSSTHPSTDKQKRLGRMLVEELVGLGCKDAWMAESGHVYATVPANLPPGHPNVPVLGFLAHLDTYPGTSGENVVPQVVESYAGGDLRLRGTGDAISPATNPRLLQCLGHTLVHSDGTTLLGADDKAGVAEIVTMVDWLFRHPEASHGKVRIAFTPDEEIGRGIERFDLHGFGADYAYTVDGSGAGEVEDETFSADSATITVRGHDVHPGQAKNVMVNAVRVAAAIVAELPVHRLPETTEGREPYLHPYTFEGDVSRARIGFLVRAFCDAELREQEDVLRRIASEAGRRFPGATVQLEITPSYRNMGEQIAKDPKVIDYAIAAVARQGIDPVRRAVRGGTDGSRLSAMGLLTPNLFTGGQNPHSVHEWASLTWMADAVGVCLQLLAIWAEASRGELA